MKLEELEKNFKDGQKTLCPHEPLAALCMVVEESDKDYEVVFTVPINWLISKLNEKENVWDQEKLFYWLNEEYTSYDSEWIWEEACISKQLVTFNVF